MNDVDGVNHRADLVGDFAFFDDGLFAGFDFNGALVIGQADLAVEQGQFGAAIAIDSEIEFGAANSSRGGWRAELSFKGFIAIKKMRRRIGD